MEDRFYAAKLLTEELLDDLVERLKGAESGIVAELDELLGSQGKCKVNMARKGTEDMSLSDVVTGHWPYVWMSVSLPHRDGMLRFSFGNGGKKFEGGMVCYPSRAFGGSGSTATDFRAPAVSYGNFTFACDEELEDALKRWRLWSGEVLAAFREAMKEFVQP